MLRIDEKKHEIYNRLLNLAWPTARKENEQAEDLE